MAISTTVQKPVALCRSHDTRRQFFVQRTFTDRRQFATPGHQITTPVRLRTSSSAAPMPFATRPLRPASRSKWSSCSVRMAECCRSEEHTSELQSQSNLVCRLLLEKKKQQQINT